MKKLFFAIFALAMISCQDNEVLNVAEDVAKNELAKVDYAIPVDRALAYLNDFMEQTDDVNSRTGKRIVSSITPIKYRPYMSRTTQDEVDCDNLVYVANFEQESGYAILAADNRIGDKVLAIADTGSLSDTTVYAALELANNSERVIFEEYPTTGPGFFTIPEYGDEVFMNPNTVDLYIEDEQDTLVGNFSLDDEGAVDENGIPILEPSLSLSTPELTTSALCVNYALNEINDYEDNRYLNLQIADDDPPIMSSSSDSIHVERVVTDWSIKEMVAPILTEYVEWHQSNPFNNLYPYRRKYIVFGKKRRAPAGCFPLAIAKILAHFEHPNPYTFNGYTINWTELKRNFRSTIGRQSAAALLKSISSGSDSWYFYQGTFTFPYKATSFMRLSGLRNADYHDYSFARIVNMLNNGCPVIAYALPNINITKSHSWNIDGYKVKERTITLNVYNHDVLKESSSKTESYKMVHCDFGWSGKCNGYYVSGIFDLNDFDNPNVEIDAPHKGSKDVNYNNHLRVITYDRP